MTTDLSNPCLNELGYRLCSLEMLSCSRRGLDRCLSVSLSCLSSFHVAAQVGLLGSPGYIGGFFISGKPHVEKQSVFISPAISGLVLTSYGQCTLVWSRTRAFTAHVNVTNYRCCCKVQARVESHNALSLVPGTTPGKKSSVLYI